eukprot:CAMPEP_0177589850 /NCGR_PEP_ID=MMETSP0419_2-20121207/7052_1 /TAXON_ID=582737 /ORGANISM="Tetraselmis sp., Strain GSL018" /LENGTH=434 /DNA_ID=CAMNT_0019080289 /DNA_START=211 /DNA_END=1515 /DNA_ORIENTATION=-
MDSCTSTKNIPGQNSSQTKFLVEALSAQKKKLESQLQQSPEHAAIPGKAACQPQARNPAEPSNAMDEVAAIAGSLEEALAGVTGGMSGELRQRIRDAIADLNAVSRQDAQLQRPPMSPAEGDRGRGRPAEGAPRRRGAPPTSREAQLEAEASRLRQKLAMANSVMRKLYSANVSLEKEVQVISASGMDVMEIPTDDPRCSPEEADAGSDGAASPSRQPATSGRPLSAVLEERDRTIGELKMALAASRRRAAALERSLACGQSGRAAQKGGARQAAELRDLLSRSALHFKQYQQIRHKYNSLLSRRTEALRAAPGASREAKAVVRALQKRLTEEVEEREAEAAMYNAQLYHSERHQGDWYVERRLLERRVEEMDKELSERDRVDAEIEACVCSLFDRISSLEGDNRAMREKLAALGIAEADPKAEAPAASPHVSV